MTKKNLFQQDQHRLSQEHLSYLSPSTFIDSDAPTIMTQARLLSIGNENDIDIARNCFEFVRDKIKHSWDYQLNPVTCKASDVLKHGTGFCYAKSHLLAALLRANDIPAGLCYQRLTIQPGQPPFCLHGLNAIYLEAYGWFRVDARGNKEGVQADFNPPSEQLAFPIEVSGEADFPEVWAEPLPIITDVLTRAKNVQWVAENLPDVPIVLS